jgi:predicted transcriptional regulator
MAKESPPKSSFAFNIRTDVSLGALIQKEAARRGETASFVFREAVREYLARREKEIRDAQDSDK